MKRLAYLLPAISLAVAMLASHPVAAAGPSVFATINGGGTAIMQPGGLASGTSSFGFEATLFSDGSAKGHFDCVDQMGSPTGAGNIFGDITNWSLNADGSINLQVTGKVLNIPGGHPGPAVFTVTIQTFGGAGVGHWTLSAGGLTFCVELVTSGQISIHRN
jgi:hypothetical protein